MFFLKKLISRFFFPLPMCVGLLISGLLLICFTKRQKLGRRLAFVGMTLLLLVSYPPVPQGLLSSLESRYRSASATQLLFPPETSGDRATSGFIFVLGESVSSDPTLPANQRFSDVFAKRMIEAARLHRLFPDRTVAVSIGNDSMSTLEKESTAREFFAICGFTNITLLVCASSRDTEQEIQWIKATAGTNSVLLVSCASHLPRAARIAGRMGVNATPCPSGFVYDPVTPVSFSPAHLFPAAPSLSQSERAIYEGLGLIYESLKPARATDR
jgi:uncharacterized SAM-binding protein YcdF (DUF218 family)